MNVPPLFAWSRAAGVFYFFWPSEVAPSVAVKSSSPQARSLAAPHGGGHSFGGQMLLNSHLVPDFSTPDFYAQFFTITVKSLPSVISAYLSVERGEDVSQVEPRCENWAERSDFPSEWPA